MNFTKTIQLYRGSRFVPRSAFRVIYNDRTPIEYKHTPTRDMMNEMYSKMVQLQVMDHILNETQRQGRISFYMQTNGEEGSNIGIASALDRKDMVLGQYREAGLLLWRGFTFQQFTDQCFGTKDDLGKGRQMPVHYGSKDLNFHTISSPLTTQVPQAAGVGYHYKNTENIVTCIFGEGAASEGDFHAGLNFASTLECPVMFICRNNQYAISTHSSEQYRGDGVVSRADGYGMDSLRIDGNDALAVHIGVKVAREHILKTQKPMLIELMSYRIGHHSTSDDSTAYRSKEEIDQAQASHPINILGKYLQISDSQRNALQDETRKIVLNCIKESESKGAGDAMSGLFKDVYHEIPKHLQNIIN